MTLLGVLTGILGAAVALLAAIIVVPILCLDKFSIH